MKYQAVSSEPHMPYLDRQAKEMEDFAVFRAFGWGSDALNEALREAHVLMVDCRNITREVMLKAPDLVMIVQYGVGTDNIDMRFASQEGILVCNVPNAYSREVAEHALGLIMSLARCIVPAVEAVKRGVWETYAFEPLLIEGKTLGVLGFGRIGQSLARSAKGLGLEVLASDPHMSEDLIRSKGARPVPMASLLSESDIISIHTFLSSETRHLLGKEEFSRMKDGVLLVNTSRGEVLDEGALLEALQSGKVRAAAADVLTREPPPRDHPLLALPNFIVTPHMAWRSEKANYNLEMGAARQVHAAFSGVKPEHLVNSDVWERARLHRLR